MATKPKSTRVDKQPHTTPGINDDTELAGKLAQCDRLVDAWESGYAVLASVLNDLAREKGWPELDAKPLGAIGDLESLFYRCTNGFVQAYDLLQIPLLFPSMPARGGDVHIWRVGAIVLGAKHDPWGYFRNTIDQSRMHCGGPDEWRVKIVAPTEDYAREFKVFVGKLQVILESKTDNKPDSEKKLPKNPKVTQLAMRLRSEGSGHGQMIIKAREITQGDEAEAQSLVRECRRFPHLYLQENQQAKTDI